MRRGTTPTLELEIDTSLAGCEYYVTIENARRQITKRDTDCTLSDDGKTIYVPLSQEDTLSFDASYPALVQVRFKVGDQAFATNVVGTDVESILMEGEI